MILKIIIIAILGIIAVPVFLLAKNLFICWWRAVGEELIERLRRK